MSNQKYLRFVHVMGNFQHSNGMTFAYARGIDSVQFSYAICVKPDRYNKKIGRQKSTDAFFNEHAVWPLIRLNKKYRVGVLTKGDFIDDTFSQHFAPNFIEKITIADFSHSLIECKLRDMAFMPGVFGI